MAYVAMYQKFKLIRERNQLELQLHGMTTKLERMGKNISKKEKYYTSLFEKLNQQATNLKNQAKIGFQTFFGVGANCVNPMNYSGVNNFVLNAIYSQLQKGVTFKDSNGTEVTYDWNTCDWNAALQSLAQYNSVQPLRKSDGSIDYADEEKQIPKYPGNLSPEHVQFLEHLKMQASVQLQNNQMMANNAMGQYEANVSIWLEAQQAQLEAEKDSVLGALQYEQTMMNIDKEYIEMRLQEIEQLEKSYDEKLKKDIERGIPKFGL